MKTTVEITLIENSMAGGPTRILAGQRVQISGGGVTRVMSVDGIPAHGNHPWHLLWSGGFAADLRGVTDVKMVDNSGEVIVDGELDYNSAPSDVLGGVEFRVLRRE